MKITQKQAATALKNSRGTFYVYSFDPFGPKRRSATHGGLDFIKAFAEMTNRLAEGRLVVVTDEAGYKELSRIEISGKRRVTYDEAYPYSLKVNDDYKGNPIGKVTHNYPTSNPQ